jgi:hypothetical protein
MANAIVELENQLKNLKKEVRSKKNMGEDDVDRLKYIEEEIKGIVEEWKIGVME